MEYSRAFELIHELAAQNQIDENDIAFGDKGLAEQRAWQQEALDTVEDFVVNYYEEIDERFSLPNLEALKNYPIEQVAADRAMSPSSPGSALRIVLDMARGNLLDDDPDMQSVIDEQSMAVSLVEDFIVRHSDELAATMTTLRV